MILSLSTDTMKIVVVIWQRFVTYAPHESPNLDSRGR